MALVTFTTVVSDMKTDGDALNTAVGMAQRNNGHLEVLCLGIDRTQPGFYTAGAVPLAIQSSMTEAENHARDLEQGVTKTLQNQQISWSTRAVSAQLPGLALFLAHRTRFTDLSVLSRPCGNRSDHVNEVIIESALFDARVPVLAIPENTSLAGPIRRIVIGWNESQEALTAVRFALPLLKAADVVNIVLVDPPSHALDRSDPGGALAQMLSRHGICADVSVLAKTTSEVSDIIARHLADQNADILVMGAYGHSRIRESILGGATRNMLKAAKIPVFMAH